MSLQLPEQQRSRLIVRPPTAVVSGKLEAKTLAGKFQGSLPEDKAVTINLGEARTDHNGRLVFIGGSGYSKCVSRNTQYNPDKDYPDQPDITSEFDSIDWVDTMCDGVISVRCGHSDNKDESGNLKL